MATAAALACAVHCVLAPFLVVALPAFVAGEALEPWMLGIVVLLGAHAMWTGLRLHRRPRVAFAFVIGVTVWAASLAGILAPLPETATSALGSLGVAGAMVWNARQRHRHTCGRQR